MPRSALLAGIAHHAAQSCLEDSRTRAGHQYGNDDYKINASMVFLRSSIMGFSLDESVGSQADWALTIRLRSVSDTAPERGKG
jgi:hypothetical protein